MAFIKLGPQYHLRYQIASGFIKPGDRVLDVCSGPGAFKDFLPAGCSYTALEASPAFAAALKRKGRACVLCDLHQGLPPSAPDADVIVMNISLCQFRKTSADVLLESFKIKARRVVIVEDVLSRRRTEDSLFQKAVNFLCATDYYVPVEWYTRSDFRELMRRHGYQCRDVPGRYAVGSYENGAMSQA